MDLREFVRETLVEIQYGVHAAIKECLADKDFRGAINPVWGAGWDAITEKHVRLVEFDVAVTVSEASTVGGKAGIKVFSIAEVGAEGTGKTENSTVSHIKFSVPIIPATTIVWPSEAREGGQDAPLDPTRA